MHAYRRGVYWVLEKRLAEPRRFIQVLLGPRQTGKTTVVRQLRERLTVPCHYASADDPGLQSSVWLRQQWDIARVRAASEPRQAILMLDEVHKIPGWSDVVKTLWDQDTDSPTEIKVVLLGSSPLLMERGLGESLSGRFEVIRAMHWSYQEMRDAFGWDLDQYVCFGGFPGPAPLVDDPVRWGRYINDALIETTLSRDILLMTRVHKPALLRRLFDLACAYSGSILSYQKMIGQLSEAGNTTTLAHYLDLLSSAGMVCGLDKFSGHRVRQRSSSPKLQVFNTAYTSARNPRPSSHLRQDPAAWGHLCESAIGAHLVNSSIDTGVRVYYWRDRGEEVDFVLQQGDRLTAIEVKTGHPRNARAGLDTFCRIHPTTRPLLIGSAGLPLEEFLLIPIEDLLPP